MAFTTTTLHVRERIMTIDAIYDHNLRDAKAPHHHFPPASRDRPKKSPNDVRVNPASTEVISNLLASLSSVSVGSADESPLIPSSIPRTPSPRPVRHPASARSSIKPRGARDPSIDYPEIVHPPPPAVQVDLPPEGDIALPPTIRTSRRPSGYSKITAQKQPRGPPSDSDLSSEYLSAESPSIDSSGTRPLSQLAPLPRLASRNKTSSARSSSDEARRNKALAQRDSSISHRSRESKGKQRAKHDSISSLDNGETVVARSSSKFGVFSPRSAQTYLSKHPSRETSIHENEEYNDGSSASLQQSASVEEFVVVHRKNRDSRPGIRSHGRKFIPSRNSSLRINSDSPPTSRYVSQRSSRHSFHRSPETVPEEDVDLGNSGTGLGQDLYELTELDERHGTVKRIKELQQAREARLRMQAVSELPVVETNGVRLPSSDGASTKLDPYDHGQKQDGEEHQRQRLPKTANRDATNKEIEPHQSQTFLLPPDSDSPAITTVRRIGWGTRSPEIINAASLDLLTAAPPVKLSLTSSPLREKSMQRSNSEILPSLLHGKYTFQKEMNGSPVIPTEEDSRASIDSVNASVREFLHAPRLSQRIQVQHEQRQISFSEVGDPKGHAVFCCVGMGMTRYVMAFYDELATSLKLRLITPERPGVGDSSAYVDSKAPLHWPDDVRAICAHLHIQRFSLLAHSAGAIYAMATALSMPSRIRGRIQLLAPWIPPSQLTSQPHNTAAQLNGSGTTPPKRNPPTPQPIVPRSQRLLRLIPTPFFKLTNAGGFLAARVNKESDATSSPSPSYGNSTRSRKFTAADSSNTSRRPSLTSRVPRPSFLKSSRMPPPPSPTLPPAPPHLDVMDPVRPNSMEAAVLRAGNTSTPSRPGTPGSVARVNLSHTHSNNAAKPGTPAPPEPTPRQRAYDATLTQLIWDLSTRNANPHIDLVVCLERQRPIGFHYADVARAVVIRHGSRDGRVPVENVVWLGGVMRGAEVKVLEGEGHGLMGRASVMGDVLAEVANECVR